MYFFSDKLNLNLRKGKSTKALYFKLHKFMLRKIYKKKLPKDRKALQILYKNYISHWMMKKFWKLLANCFTVKQIFFRNKISPFSSVERSRVFHSGKIANGNIRNYTEFYHWHSETFL